MKNKHKLLILALVLISGVALYSNRCALATSWWINNDGCHCSKTLYSDENLEVRDNANIGSNLDVVGNITGARFYGHMHNETLDGWELDLKAINEYKKITNMKSGYVYGFRFFNNTLISDVEGIYKMDFTVTMEGSGEYGAGIFINETQTDCYDFGYSLAWNKFHRGCVMAISKGDILSLRLDDHQVPVADPTIYVAGIRVSAIDD